mgnify:CR=1 FL=1
MPDEPRLPTEEELRTLPRWAAVAYAARCARRVQPLFTHFWPDAPPEHVEAVDKAINCAITAAASAGAEHSPAMAERTEAANTVARAIGAAKAVGQMNAAFVANAAHAAAHAARGDSLSASAAFDASAHASHAADNSPEIAEACSSDFGLLGGMAVETDLHDGSAVLSSDLGPLWHFGEPSGWPGQRTHALLAPPYLALFSPTRRAALAIRCAMRAYPILSVCDSPECAELMPVLEHILANFADATTDPSSIGYEVGYEVDELDASIELLRNSANTRFSLAAANAIGSIRSAWEVVASLSKVGFDAPDRLPGQIADTYEAFRLSGDAVAMALSESGGSGNSGVADDAAVWDAQRLLKWQRSPLKRPTRELVDALGPLWPDGLPEGWPVHDPDRSLPGFDELDALPPRAALLIGLRACRRVAEFIRGTDLADAERPHLLGVLQTIEAYCRGESVKFAPETARDVARSFADHRTPAGAYDAAEAALHLAESNLRGSVGVFVAHALDQALSAADNAERAGRGEHLREELLASVRADFDRAKRIHLVGEATDQPWPPDRLGPLWPHGEPPEWRDLRGALPPPFALAIDPGEADAATIQEVLAALSDLHEAHTGFALVYRIEGALIHAEAEVYA